VPLVSHQNLGDSKEIWEKFFWGSVDNKYIGKVTEAFQKIPSSFGAVVRKQNIYVGSRQKMTDMVLSRYITTALVYQLC